MTEIPPAPDSAHSSSAVLAIDPGRAKCGLAIVARSGTVLYRGIVPSLSVGAAVQDLAGQFAIDQLILGNGTGAATIYTALNDTTVFLPITRVDEKYTSEQARAVFLKENPPRGLQRLVPPSLRAPAGPYDDYVAVLLARRYLAAESDAESD